MSLDPGLRKSPSQQPVGIKTGSTYSKQLGDLVRSNRMKAMKLHRLTKYNEKLKENLTIDRVLASNSSLMIIDYTERTKDMLIPAWGKPEKNRYETPKRKTTGHKSDCCVIT